MNEKEAKQPPQAGVPKVEPRPRGRISIVWLIPLGAALLGGWLAYRTISKQGPSITIAFETADGLEAGKTKILYKGMQAGLVDEIHPTEDLSSVTVYATLVKQLKPHLNDGVRFWVVRPEISLSRVSGLGTLVSGDYIAFQPGSGAPTRAFKGLNEPPVEAGDAAHRKFVLRADNLGSLDRGSPVLYRGVTVGKVLGYTLPDDDKPLTVDIIVHEPHHRLVRENTQFWNASGIKFNMGDLFDASVEVESFKSLLEGGIAFANPAKPGPAAKAGTAFPLLDERPAKPKSAEGGLAIVLKSANLSSVKAGDPILYREFQVGKVVEVGLDAQATSVDLKIAIAPDYAPLVKTNTVFWNASGINANFSLFSGASIDIESLRALLDGGIAFATPDQGGRAVKPGAVFTLHDRPKKEWRAWAPHIRLHEDTAPQAKTTTGGVSKPPAPSDSKGAAAAQEGGAKEGGDAATPALSELPTSVTLPGRVTTSVLKSPLEDLGYANISAIEKSGSIFHLRADWQGQPVKLRIDSRDGEIKVMGR
jgi:paraquat-inducible protein B